MCQPVCMEPSTSPHLAHLPLACSCMRGQASIPFPALVCAEGSDKVLPRRPPGPTRLLAASLKTRPSSSLPCYRLLPHARSRLQPEERTREAGHRA